MQGIVTKNVVKLHKKPDFDSEQVSQAILGHAVEIEAEAGEWLAVRAWDGYRGFAQARWVLAAPPRENAVEVTSLFANAWVNGEIRTKLVITSRLEHLRDEGGYVRVRLPTGEEVLIHSKDLRPRRDGLIRTTRRFMGIPYLWGGSTPFGIDCSGFTQLVFRLHGVPLLRDAHMQADDPRGVRVEEPETGDLVFFERGGRVNHVGIACGDGAFIHSAGRGVGVTVSPLYGEYEPAKIVRMPGLRLSE
ncbi:MAG: C40 family peptidase [Armatimonadota bacterium]